MHTLLWRTGPRRAFALAVGVVLLASHLPLLVHAPATAAALLLAAVAWSAYRAASTIWHLTQVWFWRFAPVTTLATIFVIAMLGHVDVDLGYTTAGNMAVAR